MGQETLSSLLMLHVHKDLTDSLDLLEVANNFVILSIGLRYLESLLNCMC